MSRSILVPAAIAAAAFFACAPAWAHVTLEAKEAVAGASFKAVFRVPHGCEGAATTSVRVRFPDGTLSPKPMPKAGWTVAVQTGALPAPVKVGNDLVTTGVIEIAWTGGKLPDDNYDEFVIQMTLPDKAGTTVLFPIVQECDGGKVNRWILAPGAAAQNGPGGETNTAPALKLNPKP